MTEHRFQLSDKRRDAILVARGDDPVALVGDFDTLLKAYDDAFGTMPPAQHQVSPAEQMVQRPANQPGGLGAVPVQSTGADLQPCPNGGSHHHFRSEVSKKTGKPWKAWICGDKRCNMDGRGGNYGFLQ